MQHSTQRFFTIVLLISGLSLQAQENSIARQWNEEVLHSISLDFARPTIHARNLFHTSIAMYDAWAAYQPGSKTYLLGQNLHGFESDFIGVASPIDIEAAQNEAISFAVYRIIKHRYGLSPNVGTIDVNINGIMDLHGYDIANESTDYINGGPAELGNYIADQIIAYGMQDGSNEANNYVNNYYQPINPPIEVEEPGNPDMIFPNRFQQITLSVAIDQSGNVVSSTPAALSPEWGEVQPFSLTDDDLTIKTRDGNDYNVYHDPGDPAYIDTTSFDGLASAFKKWFVMVSVWQSHHDENDGVIWDISPASLGNIQSYPTTVEDYDDFYNYFEGGDTGEGYAINPVTGMPYEPQLVKRADYVRSLAEFWADGPNSVTPPGHWFDIYNGISDHPLYEKKWMGIGPTLDNLEYDVRAYLAIGGAMHDAAIVAWGIKGYYDYPRPVSTLRYMAEHGQCSNPELPNYHAAGLPLIPDYVEVVEAGDPLQGLIGENIGKIKLYTWKGPEYIENPQSDVAGVGWILAENWWPYQRPSFVTPPFSGYISGHSTYSRTAAELFTLMTGDAYFPGGMSGYEIEQNEFLVFEEGPTESFEIQWATYRDASDQCSLSRIWGGIHPPIDDMPGRHIGMDLGPEAFNFANDLVSTSVPHVTLIEIPDPVINIQDIGSQRSIRFNFNEAMNTTVFPTIVFPQDNPLLLGLTELSGVWQSPTAYKISYQVNISSIEMDDIFIALSGAENSDGVKIAPFLAARPFLIDTKRPVFSQAEPDYTIINDDSVSSGMLSLEIEFSEPCNQSVIPLIMIQSGIDVSTSITYSPANSSWISDSTFSATFSLTDNNIEVADISLMISNVVDEAGNTIIPFEVQDIIEIDTKNPQATAVNINDNVLIQSEIGSSALIFNIVFDEAMDMSFIPDLVFIDQDPLANSLVLNQLQTVWLSANEIQIVFDLLLANEELFDIAVSLENFHDIVGNVVGNVLVADAFTIDTKKPEVVNITPLVTVISDLNLGVSGFSLMLTYPEAMNTTQIPLVQLLQTEAASSLALQLASSTWLNDQTFQAGFNVTDQNIELEGLGVSVAFAKDLSGNTQIQNSLENVFAIDTKNPQIISLSANDYNITDANIGENGFDLLAVFDEAMDENSMPFITFAPLVPTNAVLVPNDANSFWLNPFSHKTFFDVVGLEVALANVAVNISAATDQHGNAVVELDFDNFLSIFLSPLSATSMDVSDELSIFPNVLNSGDLLYLRNLGSAEDLIFQVYDLNGKKLFNKTYARMSAGVQSIVLPELSIGMYICTVQSGGNIYSGKIIVQ